MSNSDAYLGHAQRIDTDGNARGNGRHRGGGDRPRDDRPPPQQDGHSPAPDGCRPGVFAGQRTIIG